MAISLECGLSPSPMMDTMSYLDHLTRLQIWDCHMGNEVALYQDSSMVTCVAFSRDGSRVTIGSTGVVRVWNPSTGQVDNLVRRCPMPHFIAFSHDDSYVISGSSNGVWIWNLTTNESGLSKRIQLPDGTRVHFLYNGHCHIYDPVDQETTNDIPPYLLRISSHRDCIIGTQAEHNCWIPPQYQKFDWVSVVKSIVCFGYWKGRIIVLNLQGV